MTPEIGDGPGGYVTVGAGNYGFVTTSGAVESTLVDDILAARLAFNCKGNDRV